MTTASSSADTVRRLRSDSRWRQPFQVLQTNLQPIDALMDVDEAVEAARDYGADAWLLNAGGILSFYPTELPFQTRSPMLDERPSGDLLGDAVTAAHAAGVRVIARFDMSKVSASIAADHPEWLYRSIDGEPQVYASLSSACPSGEYYQRRTFDVLDEVLDRYEVDGVFFNWFNFNERDYGETVHDPCHCEACQRGFAAFSGGQSLPDGMRAPTFGAWRAFTAATLADLTARIVDHVEGKGRDVAVILRRGAPVEYLEGNNAFRAMPGKELWPYSTGEAVSAAVSTDPDAVALVNCVSFVDSTYRLAPEQPEHFAHHMLQTIARGGNPSAYFFGAPGRFPMARAIGEGRAIARFRSAHASIYAGMRSAATIALVRPDFGSAPPGGYWELVEEFRGFYQALTEAHLPFDVVPIDRLQSAARSGALDRFGLVILPDLGTLRGAGPLLDDYVERGGRVLATAGAGIGPEGHVELRSSPIAQRAAEPSKGPALRSSYATTAAQPEAARFAYVEPMVPIVGSLQHVVWQPEAVRVGALLPPAPFGPPELAYGHQVGPDPAWAHRSWGAGVSAVVAWSVGRTYREFAKSDARDLLANIVRTLVDVHVQLEGHEAIELVAGRTDAGLVAHLVNHSGLRRRSYGPHVPIDGARLRLRGMADVDATIVAEVSGIPLTSSADGADLLVDLPRLELFEVVTIATR